MIVAFRADGGTQGSGLGHIMRCIAIAEALVLEKAQVFFICQDNPTVRKILLERGFDAKWIPHDANESEDESLTLKYAEQADWVIVDSYKVNGDYLSFLYAHLSGKIAYLDDKAEIHLAIHLVIGNAYTSPTDYADNLASFTQLFAGPRYLPLRSEFIHHVKYEVKTDLNRLLITLGGEDHSNTTQNIVEILQNYQKPLHLDILVGAAYKHLDSLKNMLASAKHPFTLHQNLIDVTPLFREIDTAITAGGTTVWELAACGIPMIALQTADNQKKVIQYLTKNKMAIEIGDVSDLTQAKVFQALDHLSSAKSRQELSQNSQMKVDGKGTKRIVALLSTLSKCIAVSFKKAPQNSMSIESLLMLNWRNDPLTRKMSHSPGPISSENHLKWYEKTVNDPEKILLLAYANKVMIGVIRFDITAELSPKQATISINLNPDIRGQGLGKAVLFAACSYGLRELKLAKIKAEVKSDNAISFRIFSDAGFILENKESDEFQKLSLEF